MARSRKTSGWIGVAIVGSFLWVPFLVYWLIHGWRWIVVGIIVLIVLSLVAIVLAAWLEAYVTAKAPVCPECGKKSYRHWRDHTLPLDHPDNGLIHDACGHRAAVEPKATGGNTGGNRKTPKL